MEGADGDPSLAAAFPPSRSPRRCTSALACSICSMWTWVCSTWNKSLASWSFSSLWLTKCSTWNVAATLLRHSVPRGTLLALCSALADVPRETICASVGCNDFSQTPTVPRETSCISFLALLSFRPRGFGGADYRCGQSKGRSRQDYDRRKPSCLPRRR